MENKATSRSRVVLAVVAGLAIAAVVSGVAGRRVDAAPPKKSEKGVDAEADRMLRQMADYLSGLQSFTVQNFAVDETAFKTGEKIQATSDSEIAVQRPNHLRSTQRGAGEGLGLWYDGKTMTVACKANGSFESVAAPANIDEAIDKVRKHFKVDAPGADLLYSKPYEILMEQVVSGRVIGRETIQGIPANHLAFQGEDVDFQIWIQDGNQPLPLRFVITTKAVKGNPQFTVQLSNWNTQPKLSAADFTFQPPAGAKAATGVTSSCLAAGR
jgi:hypothetical protein